MLNFSEEVKGLCGINDRFDSEKDEVKSIRIGFGEVIQVLADSRDEAGKSEAGRNFSIAITNAEDSCMRAVKAFYSK